MVLIVELIFFKLRLHGHLTFAVLFGDEPRKKGCAQRFVAA